MMHPIYFFFSLSKYIELFVFAYTRFISSALQIFREMSVAPVPAIYSFLLKTIF